jgi:hypothetical protein
VNEKDKNNLTINERVSGLEASVQSLHSDLRDLKEVVGVGFRDLQTSAMVSSKTNWGVIITGVALLGAVYGAGHAELGLGLSEREQVGHARLRSRNAGIARSSAAGDIRSSIVWSG